MARYLVLTALAAIALPAVAQAQRLTLGSKAPQLEVDKWMRGGPIDLAAGRGQKVYVIEFWATWCGPCMQSIDHLNDLQKTYGLRDVVFLGVTDEGPDLVGKFLQSSPHGQKIEYNIACDKKDGQIGRTFKNYMAAARQNGIPTAFIVDKQGVVAWIGSPFMMEAALAQILSLKFDSERSDREISADMRYLRRQLPELQAAISDGDWGKAIELSEKIAYGDKKNCSVELRCQVLCNLVRDIMGNDEARQAFGDTAMYIAEEACTICESKDPSVLNWHADTLFYNGQIDEAIAQLKKAIEMTPDGQMKEQRKTVLAEYSRAKKGG